MKKIVFISFMSSLHLMVFSQTQLQYAIQPSSVTGVEAIVFNRPDMVNSTIPGANYILAASWTWGGTPGTYRSLIQFDLSGVPSNIVLDSVKLNLTVDSAYSLNIGVGYGQNSFTNSNKSTLKKVTGSWTPGIVTWNNQPATSTTDSVILTQSNYSLQSYSINVSNIVREWLTTPSSNNGFLLKTEIEQYYNTLVFCSSRHPKPTNRPQLVFYYKNVVTAVDPINYFDTALKVYPNPASNQVTIENYSTDLLTYDLRNQIGKSILLGAIGNQNVDVNISNLSAGIYFLQIINPAGTVVKAQKLIVN